jgi:type I restriction enzyme S subunit
MSIPRYIHRVDSGDPLIGSVPAHWNRSALKRLASYQNGFAFKPEDWADAGRPIIRIAQLTNDAEPNYFVGELDDRLRVSNGDLLFSWSATIDSFIWVKGEAWLNQHIFKVTPTEEATKAYLFYLIKFLAPKLADLDAHGSTMRHIKKESLGQLVYVPPIDEQIAISAFLDRETAKIDSLIAEQEKLIALLAEKRQATISHSVTKGLSPNMPMKASGVAWLGAVPAHWDLVPLARIALERCDGPFGSGIKSEHYRDDGALVVRLQNIRAGVFNKGESVYIDKDYFLAELQGHAVVAGDLLVAGLGDENNLLGRACVAPLELGLALVKADCFRFRLNSKLAVPYFIAWQLSAGAAYDAGVLSTGTTRSRIPLNTMGLRKVALPPHSEQKAISEFIAGENKKLDTLTAEARRAVGLLKERRSALIAAAVTGQIDVRAAVSQALTDRPEPLAA